MMILVSGGTRTVARLAGDWPERLGHLLAPGNGNSTAAVLSTGLWWAADNGAFSGFDAKAFRRLLKRISGLPRCLFVACPDVVGDARETLALFNLWRYEVAATGQPVALVGQDGLQDMEVPWDAFDAFFVGGSTQWKLSRSAACLVRQAKHCGKWVHMGRVNSKRRTLAAFDLGVDSIDGKQFSAFGDTYLARYLRWLDGRDRQTTLWPRRPSQLPERRRRGARTS
jgi:hypothetical protein